MSVREMSEYPLSLLEAMVKTRKSDIPRIVRELIARDRLEAANIKNAEISSHAQDAIMVRDKIHRLLGLCVVEYEANQTTKDRIMLSVAAMTHKEKKTLLDALLSEGDEEEVQP